LRSSFIGLTIEALFSHAFKPIPIPSHKQKLKIDLLRTRSIRLKSEVIVVDTRTSAQATANWNSSHGSIPAKYAAGVASAQNVIEKSIAAKDNYEAGVQAAISRGAREKGLAKTSTAEWRKAATDKGAVRIVAGMKASEGKFNKGIGEVISTLQSITLPPRTQDPMANVTGRVGAIAVGLHDRFKK
jgi:hypothetical protein